MRIRKIRSEDYAEVARLRRLTIQHVNAKYYSEESIHNWSTRVRAQDLKKSSNTYKRWIALEKEKIIGFCEHNLDCEISRLYTHKDFLGKGVGSLLLEAAEASLEMQGCKEIRLGSTITAKGFYRKKGYKFNKKIACKADGSPIYIMLKKLL